MSFIQIIDYETDRAAEIDAAMRAMLADMPVEPGFIRLEQTQDHDNPRHYMTIVEFPSYETGDGQQHPAGDRPDGPRAGLDVHPRTGATATSTSGCRCPSRRLRPAQPGATGRLA